MPLVFVVADRERPGCRRSGEVRHPDGTHGYDCGMTRAVVVGNGGGGKSTLARALAERHNLAWCSVDQVQWAPGWERAPEDLVAEHIRSVMASDRWIIDGWGPWPSIEERMELSDTLIFVDLPLWMHFWLAAERQISIARGQPRSDPVEGCDDLAITRRLFETIWHVDQILKPQLLELVDRYAAGRDYHHVTTLEQLEELAAA
jgi:adenylate kinase family enzyme